MYRVITATPRGEITTDVPIEVEHEGPKAVEAFVAADVAKQLAALSSAKRVATKEG